ncbi:hypothetical protein A3Q56_03155 [Intoshia linei]|uniref:non-specific serine/threonine protein kinase n=1 Tax=Intoshia linei TaxID=1819745 RepID=A0A177B4M6_9BILA|nr:hypothetical protein A3Q56_03155 [Intoshia linei]
MSVKGTFSHKKKCNYFSNKNPSNLYTRNYKIHQTSLKAIYFCTLKKTLENAVIKIVDIRNENYNENMKKCIREIKCIDKLNHDNVIKHHFASMDVDKIWIVMEPCIGSIQDLMKVHKVYFNEKEIIAIVKQTLSGLIYIHNKNRIHRDIKSSHLLITYNGIVKISNFESSSNQRQSNKFEGSL